MNCKKQRKIKKKIRKNKEKYKGKKISYLGATMYDFDDRM